MRNKKKICDCGDPECKREVKSNKNGKLFVINHFTCGTVKKIINNHDETKYI